MKSKHSPGHLKRGPIGSTRLAIPVTSVIVLGFGMLLSACGTGSAGGTGSADTQSACDQAFAQAVAIDPGTDTVESIGGAVAECQSLEEWVAAAQQFPDAFGGSDPTTLAQERCAASPDLATTPICLELSGQ